METTINIPEAAAMRARTDELDAKQFDEIVQSVVVAISESVNAVNYNAIIEHISAAAAKRLTPLFKAKGYKVAWSNNTLEISWEPNNEDF